MTTPRPRMYPADVIQLKSLAGRLRSAEDLLNGALKMRPVVAGRAAASGADWLTAFDEYIKRLKREHNKLLSLLSESNQEQEEQRGEENQTRRDA